MRPLRALVAAAVALAIAAPPAGAVTRYIFTVAGNGAPAYGGDGRRATKASFDLPREIAPLPGGGFLVAETNSNVVRRVLTDGTIRTVAGDGLKTFGGDGGPAKSAQLDFVHDVEALPRGGFLIADMKNKRVRRVTRDGDITTVAGTGARGSSGDGGPATQAELSLVHGVGALPDGGFLIADTDNDRIRRVYRSGKIRTVAGSGASGFGGDEGPATSAQLSSPFDVAPLRGGGFLIADTGNHAIRRVFSSGRITTVAGVGVRGYSGDGGNAGGAQLDAPHTVIPTGEGGFLIADTGNDAIRKVSPSGRIETVAGTGAPGSGGDGRRATNARLNAPKGIAPTGGGGFLVADSGNNLVRLVSTEGPRPLGVAVGGNRRSLRLRYRWTPVTALAGGRTRLRFRATVRSRVRVDIRRKGASVLRLRTRAKPGRNVLVLPAEVGPGRYRIEMTATTADGQKAEGNARLAVVAPAIAPLPARADDHGIAVLIWPLGATGVAMVGAGGLLVLRNRSLRRRDRERRARRMPGHPAYAAMREEGDLYRR